MKIGILSMQKVINYGSFLQAYALKTIMEHLGNEVRFIDIKEGDSILPKKINQKHIFIDKYIFKRIQHVLYRKKRNNLFLKELFPMIGISSPVEEESCDLIVIGSDEVFNCCNSTEWGVSLQLFGNTARPTITYAASCGFTRFSDVEKLGLSQELALALSKLQGISVRDQNTCEFVEQLITKRPLQHLDPVLIYRWDREIVPQRRFKDYILVYAYDNRINSLEEIETIKQFAKKHKKKLISFGVYQRWCDRNILCTPFELLAYFDGADYVITDTFHGSVISISRNKKFATIIRDSNRNKIHDLLLKFRLEGHEVAKIDDLESIILSEIDYTAINNQLELERYRTIDYLSKYIHVG